MTPRATPSQLQSRRAVSTRASRASARLASGSASQPSRRSAIASTAPSSTAKEVSRADLGRQRRGELAGDLEHPRVAGGDRQRPAGRGLDRDHPEGLRKGARHDQRLGVAAAAPRPRRARGGRSARPTRPSPGRPRRSPAEGRRGRPRGSAAASPPRPPAPGRAAPPRGRRRGLRGRALPSSRRRPALVLAEPGELEPRLGVPALTRGQAARSRSTPLETISLPTKTTVGAAVGGRGRARPARPPSPPPAAGTLRVDARRSEPGLLPQARDRRAAPPRGTRRCGGSRRGRRRRLSCPLRRRGGSARCGLTVYSRAEPWTLAAKGPIVGAGEDRRAHDQVVGEGHVDSADAAPRPRGRRRRWPRCSGRAPPRSAPGRP